MLTKYNLDLNKYKNWFDYFYQTRVANHKKIKVLFIADCDGVLTDGRSYCDSTGKFAKSYGSYDKEAIMFLTKYCGDSIFFVSDDKEGWPITEKRLKHLSESLNVGDKFGYDNLSAKEREEFINNVKKESKYDKIIFIGDSLSDINAMSISDFAATTKNSPHILEDYVNYISQLEGGKGALADIIFYFYNYFL